MATRLVYNGKTYTDATIITGLMTREKSPLSDTLTYDTLVVKILDRSGEEDNLQDLLGIDLQDFDGEQLVVSEPYVDLVHFIRGTAGDLYYDERYLGKYYIDSVERNSKREYTLNFISALGILNKIEYRGGIFDRVPCGDIIANIMGGTYVSQDDEFEYYSGSVPFYVQKTLKNVVLSGWIPFLNSSRDALQQVLFAVGGSVLKASDGLLKFAFWQPTEAVQISNSRLYIGGSIEYPSKYTKVVVTEHEFRQTDLDKEVELFDSQGITVNRKLVKFANPCHGITSTTLTIHESNPNYAIVSGVGKLVGYEFTHNTVLIEKITGASGDESVAQISGAYLVSSLNSLNVAERVAAYYGFADLVNYGMVVNGDVTVGDRISFTDPFGDVVTGYIVSEEINLSANLKSNTKIATNWQPNHQGNQYNNFTILSSGSSWTVPTALRGTPARVVIFGGFEGGQGGFNGANGENANAVASTLVYGGQGGEGGKGGSGGSKVNLLIVDIPSLANSYSYTLGVGGSGGNPNGGVGSIGTDSVFGGMSSADGSVNTTGWANPINGVIYNDAAVATKGVDGADGGKGGGATQQNAENGLDGGNLSTYKGGKGAAAYVSFPKCYAGGGGGGASIEANGTNGTVGANFVAGNGGNGGSVISIMPQATLGQCGKGGAGAGGGGGGAGAVDTIGGVSFDSFVGVGGTGGTGQKGQQGSNGFILVMHN